MKQFRNMVKTGAAVLGVWAIVLLLAGCATTQPPFEEFQDPATAVHGNVEKFHDGDLVVISFAGPGLDKKPHEERIKDDHTITPPDIGSIIAAGKTAGELQKELQAKYDLLYKNLTVTVKAGDRYYAVDGEVRQPGPKPYLGDTDVVNAIAAGGGFTEFAKKSKILVTRKSGKKYTVDYEEALQNSAENLPVYPGDQIYVPRRIFW
ncbi:MAG TPA: polysaccharide biosynthesis/export family protein [Verrucomicrobiae bacterium]|nr:polysaccharide biosynthesis/export family protein [Verrucomicrobiae bacterium]